MRMPTAGTPYTFSDIIAAKLGFLKSRQIIAQFETLLKNYINQNHVRLVNSGTTGCYLLLEFFKSIRKSSKQREVIISDYTAPSLLLPIQKAGLDCVVVDTSPTDFNIDINQIESMISDKTLAIMPIHMFGIPTNVEKIKSLVAEKEIFVFEDAASSLGSKIRGKHTGTVANFGFYSLNRGKNISSLSGGIITWQSNQHTKAINKLADNLPQLSKSAQLSMLFKFFALTLAVRPFFYTFLNPLISQFKYTTLHTDFESFAYTPFQASLGKNIFRREKKLTKARIGNGQQLTQLFQSLEEVTIPKIDDQITTAFNQFPLLIKDFKKLEQLEQQLLNKGIETSRLYGQALHQIFPKSIKNADQPFPNAEYLAEHLLLIPTHPQIKARHLKKIETIVQEIFK